MRLTAALAHARRRLRSRFAALTPPAEICTGRIEPLDPRIVLAVNVVSGAIANGTVWATGDIQHVTGDATLAAGATLTIQPGAIIKFDPFAGYDIFFNGTVNAAGTAGQPIIFTSWRDDTAGGDTNGDGAGSLPGNGNWNSIQFGSTSTATLSYVDVRYGGAGTAASTVIASDNVSFTDSTFRNSSSAGVRIDASSPTLTASTFANNSSAAASMDLASNPAISGVTMSSNLINGLNLDAGTLSGARFWNDPDIVYRFTGDITVAAGAALTVAPGQVVKVAAFAGYELVVNGTLIADGTPGQRIIFTTDRDDTAGGDTDGGGQQPLYSGQWNRIEFASGSTGNVLDNVEVRYGGASSAGAVVTSTSDLTLSNSRLFDSSNAGVRINASNPTLTNNTYESNDQAAIRMDLGSDPAISGVTMIGNGVNGIRLDGGSLPASMKWDDPDITYALEFDVTVPAGRTLTIAPGQVVKFFEFAGVDLLVNGSLVADGTAGERIVFTSTRDDTVGGDVFSDTQTALYSGQWNAIQFAAGSTGNVLDNIEVRYGGAGSAGALVVGTSGLTLSNSRILDSTSAGVRINASNPTLTGNTFESNDLGAIRMDVASDPAISGVTMLGNAINAVRLDGGALASSMKWDDPDITYLLGADVTVPVGLTLTIAPGQVVKFAEFAGVDLFVNGTLLADGTASQRIVFTTSRDDTIGGDTFNDTPTALYSGQWNAIQFAASSTGNVLDNIEARYGGASAAGMLVVATSSLTLSNSRILDSNNAGVRINASNPVLVADTFESNDQGAIRMDVASDPTISVPAMLGNAINGVQLDGGTLAASMKWDDPDITYVLGGDVTVPAGLTLTIAAGQVVKFREFSGIDLLVDGTLVADGTASERIVFTSSRDDTVGGDALNDGQTALYAGHWNAIQFGASSTGNVLDNIEARYGGAGASGTLVVATSSLALSNSRVLDSISAGVRINASNPTLTANTFESNDQGAIRMDLASDPAISGVAMIGNAINAVRLDGGTLTASTKWDDPDIDYLLSGDVTVPAGMTLTIAAGQVVKFQEFAGVDLIVNGTLAANGSAGQRIVFTSSRDDTVGADVFNDAQAALYVGQWNSIQFLAGSTGSVIDNAEVRYGGASSPGVVSVTGVGASATVSDSIVRNSSTHALVARTSGSLTATSNLLFANSDTGLRAESGGTITAFHQTIDGNFRGVAADGAGTSVTLTNSIVSNNTNAGVVLSGGAVITTSFNDVFNTTNYSGLASQTGLNGNISADPQFFNRANSQFGLRAGSQAIDSGASTGAPTTDFFGNPRFDDPNVLNLGAGTQPFFDMGAIERQEISTSDIDLRALTVSGPTTGLQGQSVTVNWTVDNLGPAAVLGSWFDAVYLSADAVFTPDDLFLGEALHTGDLAPGASYANSKQVTLPGVLPGDYFLIIRANSKNEIFEAQALVNNAAASSQPIAMDLPVLGVGTATFGQLFPNGGPLYYKINAPAGADLALTLDGPNSGFANELYLSFGTLPSRQSFDERGIRPGLADQSVSVADTRAGQYYAMVFGSSFTGTENFTLSASLAGFGITSISPARGSNTGEVTIAITGSQFDGNSQPRIIDDGGQTILPSRVLFTDSGLLSATFDLNGRTVGLADVQVVNTGDVVTTLPNALNIVAGNPGTLATNLIAPTRVRLGRDFTIFIELQNTGDTDLLAPVLELREQGAGTTTLSLTPDLADAASSLLLLGANTTGPAGVLPPGAKVRIPIYGQATANGDVFFELRLANYPNAPIDYGVVEGLIRPPGLSDAEWDPIFAQIQTAVGTSWASYSGRLADNATLLPPGLGLNYSLADVFSLELIRARAALNTSVTGTLFLGDTDRPLANTHIELVNLSTGDAFEAVSLNDGSFVFPIVPAGSYVAEFDGFVPVGAAPIVVGASDVNDLDLVVSQGATIRGGVLVSPNGVPLRDVTVIATSADGDIFTTATDIDGRFVIDSLPAGSYTVVAGGGSFSQTTLDVGALTAGQQRDHVILAVGAAGTIQGIVSGPGGPLADAVVNAVGADGQGFGVRTDATGAYAISGLKPQLYTITASGEGFVTTDLGSVNLATATTLTGVNLTLGAGGGIQGAITTAAGGAPVPFLMLTIENGLLHFTTQADDMGMFKSLDLPPGSYTVTASGGNFMTTSGVVNVTAGNLATLNLALPVLGTISGTVTNTANSQPLAKVVVHAISADGTIYDDVTDASGNYELPGLDAGSYKIVLGDPGTPGLQSFTASLNSGATAADVDFGISVAGIFSGTVFAADGSTPFSDAIVTLSQGGQSILSHAVEADGTYSLIVVSLGVYQIEVSGDGLSFPIISGLTASGTQSGLDFIAGARTISGTVRDGGSVPIAGADVIVIRTDTGAVVTNIGAVVTEADGTFSITGLVDGNYRVIARDNDFAASVQDIAIAGGNPAPLAFSLGSEAQVTGTIRDAATSSPLASATVQAINRANPALNIEVVTDGNGHYQLDGLPAGTYDLVVIAGGHESVTRGETIVAGANVIGVALPTTGASISGTITNGSHALEGVLVLAVNSAGFVLGQATTAANGSFTISGLPAGGYSIVASAAGHLDEAPLAVNLSAGQSLSGQNFTFDPAALADPSGGIGKTLADAAGGVAGWLRSVLISVERSPRQPTSADLAPLLDMANCPEETLEAIRAVTNAERKFRDWQFVQENLDGVLGTARELGFAGLQIANAAGKIILVVKSAAASAALAGASKATQLLLEFVLPVANDLANFRTALDGINRGETLDVPGAAGLLNDANNKVTSLRTKLLEAQEAMIKAAQNARNSLGNLALQDIEKTKNLLGHLAKAIGIIDAGLAAAGAINQSLDAYNRFTDQFAQFQNAREVYITAVGRANAAITILQDCSGYHRLEPNPIPPPDTRVINTTPTTQIRSSFDPNDKHGPAGFDDPATTGVNENFIQPGVMPFEIEFENIGQIAAQIVQVTDTLDADLDLTTFEFTGFGFSGRNFTVPAGLAHYSTTLDLRPDGIELLVPVSLDLNPTTRVVTMTFSTLDPLTMLAPEGFEGFLPANNANHDGEGFFTYIVSPKSSLATGATITNQASIVFDDNAPILTPTTTNTIDIDAPTSAVTALPATTLDKTFAVSWTGADTGSGVAKYDLFVSVDGGPFAFHSSHTGLSTMFTGANGHTYAFYTTASDNVGLAETAPATADTTIEILFITAPGNKVVLTDSDGDIYTVKLSGPTTAVLKYATLDPDGAGPLDGPLDSILVENATTKNSLIVTVKRKGDGPDEDNLPDGDGIVTIGSVSVMGSLGVFNAAKSDLVLDGFTASGTVKSIAIRDLAATGAITIGGTNVDKTAIKARTIADGFTFTTAGVLRSVTAADIGDGTITALALGKLTTTIGAMDADLTITDAVGPIAVKTGANAGNWSGASFGPITIKGGSFDADVDASGAIAKITVTGGDLTGQIAALGNVGNVMVKANALGSGGAFSGLLSAARFGKVALIGGDFAGELTSLTPVAMLGTKPAVSGLSIVGGDLTGDVRLLGPLGALSVKPDKAGTGGNVIGATVGASKIASVLVTRDLTNSILLAGGDLGADHAFGGGDDTFAMGTIGAVTIKGSVTASVIGAGFSTDDAILKDDDDAIIGGTASSIASLTITSQADVNSYFAAGVFKKAPKIAGVAVDPGSDARFLTG